MCERERELTVSAAEVAGEEKRFSDWPNMELLSPNTSALQEGTKGYGLQSWGELANSLQSLFLCLSHHFPGRGSGRGLCRSFIRGHEEVSVIFIVTKQSSSSSCTETQIQSVRERERERQANTHRQTCFLWWCLLLTWLRGCSRRWLRGRGR